MNIKNIGKKLIKEDFLFLSSFILFFLISQYIFFDYLFFHKINNLFLWFYFFVFCLIFFVCKIKNLNYFYFISIIFLFVGGIVSYKYTQSLMAFFLYGLFFIFLITGQIYNIKKYNKQFNYSGLYSKQYAFSPIIYVFFVIAAIIFLLFPFIMREFFWIVYNSASELRWFIPLRHLGIGGNDVPGAPFNDYKDIIFSVIFFILIIIFNYFVFKNKIKNELIILIFLIIFAFIGKIVILKLATSDLITLELKISSAWDNAYHFYAKKINNIYEFIANYINDYQKSNTSHLKGHPVLATVFYWLICKFITCVPIKVGYIIALFTSLNVIPIYYITKSMLNNRPAAYTAALFYLLTPNSLILSCAGIDSVVLLFFSYSIMFFIMGITKEKLIFAFIAGLFFGIGTYISFGIWILLLVVFGIYFVYKRINSENMFDIFKYNIIFLLGIIIFHIIFILLTGAKYNYLDSFKVAQLTIRDVANRSYTLWWWANFIHWSEYASAGIIVLYLIRFLYAFTGKIKMDFYSLISIAIVSILLFACMGRAEQHRQWMFLILLIIPASIIPLMEKVNNKLNIKMLYVNIFSFLIFLNTVILEIFVTDTN